MFLLLLISLISLNGATLLSDQYAAAGAWTVRTRDLPSMLTAYNASYSNANTTHTVQNVGDFGPYQNALSYDLLTVTLVDIIGYAPVELFTMFDPTTTQWVNNNTLRVDYTLNITTNYNATTVQFVQQGFRFTDYYVFETPTGQTNTSQVILDYGIQDPAAIELFAITSAAIDAPTLCFLIFAACNGSDVFGIPPRPYLNDTEFTTLEQCIEFMLALPLDVDNTICPFPTRSNTTTCRGTHTFAAFIDPATHCPHVRPDSVVCVNTCLPACSDCDPNASCAVSFPSIPTSFTPVYQCECNNGYIGNGAYCTPLACSYGNCPAMYGSYTCSDDNLCECTETFTLESSSTSNYCTCPSPSQIFYNSLGKPICVPKGRCIEGQQWQCNTQSYTQVKCTTYGNNTFTLFNDCLCNFGFQGGWEYPCSCPSPNRIFWSSTYNGDICLTPSQCQFTWQCAYPQTCHITSGNPIGTCM